MIEDIITLVGAAAMGSALIHPLSRRLVLGDVRNNWLMDELELDRIDVDDHTVLMKDGSYCRIYDIYGVNYDAKLLDQQFNELATREDLIHRLSEYGVHLSFYGIKRERDLRFNAHWPCSTLEEIAEQESEHYGLSYEVRWYLGVWSGNLKMLEDSHLKITSILSSYSPILLEKAKEKTPCPLTSFLNYLECGAIRRDLYATSDNLSSNLPASDIYFNKETGLIITQTPTPKYHRIVSIRWWPEIVSGKMIQEVLGLDGDIEILQYCLPKSRDKMIAALKRKENEENTKLLSRNTGAIDESQAIREILDGGTGSIFVTQTQILISADSEGALDKLVEQINGILGPKRILFSIETEGAKVAWFNRTPGYAKFTHPLSLLNRNIASIWAFHHASIGQEKSPYGDQPIRLLKTPTGQAYSFQFHIRAAKQSLGNYIVIAPSGSGKSTLINYLLSGMAKFDGTKSYYFDSKEGAKFMIKAAGGFYQSFDELSLNPLDVGEDNIKNRQHVRHMMKTMLGEKYIDDFDAEKAIEHAIELAFKVNSPDRTFNNLFDLAFESNSKVRNSFKKWVTDKKGKAGPYAHIFNAPHDSMASILSQSHIVGINMNEALDDITLGPSVVAHVSAAIEKAAKANKKGYNIFIDEGANLVRNPEFKKNVEVFYREHRKLDGVVGIAFQDPSALFESGIASAVIENTATFIFFPNSQADVKTLERFNLNQEQIDFITKPKEAPGRNVADYNPPRQVLIIKREASTGFDESAIVDIDLSPLGNVMRFYRAGVDANRDMEELERIHGQDFLRHI